MNSQIPCPQCQGPIAINTKLLIAGKQFGCDGCGAVVSLGAASVPTVTRAVEQWEAMRRKAMPGSAR